MVVLGELAILATDPHCSKGLQLHLQPTLSYSMAALPQAAQSPAPSSAPSVPPVSPQGAPQVDATYNSSSVIVPLRWAWQDPVIYMIPKYQRPAEISQKLCQSNYES